MNTRKAFITLGLVLASLVMLPVAHADEWDQASKLTFSQSVQIPGRVLPAGTYWFVLADSVGNRNIVQVFNSDRSTLYATILTTDSERLQPTDSTTITFAERELMPTNARSKASPRRKSKTRTTRSSTTSRWEGAPRFPFSNPVRL